MKTIRIFVIIILILAFTLSPGHYGSNDSRARELSKKDIAQQLAEFYTSINVLGKSFNAWLHRNVNTGVIPAVSTGIVYGDKLIFHSDLNSTIDTPFCIASLTKSFTATLILQLAEKGYVRIDEPVKKYLPGVVIERPEYGGRPVTIRHLLSHSSGMADGGSYRSAKVNGKWVSYATQIAPAGQQYYYSNNGFVILKHLIEAITGMSYAENLKKNIFEPLGMEASHGLYSNGTGGIFTTIRDLSKFAAMLINRGKYRDVRIMSEYSYYQMLVPMINIPWGRADYHCALSWEVTYVNRKVQSFYKAGRWFNGCSGLGVIPDKNMAFIYLCNPPDHMCGSFMAWRAGLISQFQHFIKALTKEPETESLGLGNIAADFKG